MGSERREIVRHAVCLPVRILFVGARPAGAASEGAASVARMPASLSRSSTSIPIAPTSGSVARIAAGAPHRASDSNRAPPPSDASTPPFPKSTRLASATSEPPKARAEAHPYHALALDVSAEGLLVEVSGVATRRFIEDSEMLPKIEVAFCTPELATHGSVSAHVRWSRPSGQGLWRLGLKLDARLTPLALQHLIDVGQGRRAEPRRVGRDVALVAATAAICGGLWLSTSSTELDARRRCVDAQADTERSLDRSQQELTACRTERAAAIASASATAVPLGDASVGADAAPIVPTPAASIGDPAPAPSQPDEAMKAALAHAFAHALDGDIDAAADAGADADAQDE